MRRALRAALSWAEQHPLLVDALLAVGMFVAAVSSLSIDLRLAALDPTAEVPGPWILGVTTVLVSLPVALRRVLPLVALFLVASGFVAARVLHNPDVDIALLTIPITVYSAAAYSRSRWRSASNAVVMAGCLGELGYELLFTIEPYRGFLLAQLFDLVYNSTLFVVPWLLGVSVRRQRASEREALSYAAEIERRRERDAQQAVFTERVRIARELHDVVAHHVSLMGIQAGAARYVFEHEPDQVRANLQSIEDSSREAVVELHRMLQFLRHDSDDPPGAPCGLHDVDRLVATAARTDVEVAVTREGEPVRLPELVDVNAFRVVQEGLTNALKHAHAQRIDVRLLYRPDALVVTVEDDGVGADDVATGGHGLMGIRERVGLHEGLVDIRSAPGRGFRIRAEFPVG